MLKTILKHNDQVSVRLQEAKKASEQSRKKWSQFISQLQNFPSLKSELESMKVNVSHFLLKLISKFNCDNEEIEEVIELKEKLNSNDIKLEALKDLVGHTTQPTASDIRQQEEDRMKKDMEAKEVEELERRIQEEISTFEEESSSLDEDLRAMKLKNTGAEKEIKKIKDFIASNSRNASDEDITRLEQQVKELQAARDN